MFDKIVRNIMLKKQLTNMQAEIKMNREFPKIQSLEVFGRST